MDIETPDVHDAETVDQMFAVLQAAHLVDEPDNPPPCGVAYRVGMRQHPLTEKFERRIIRDDCRVVAVLSLFMPLVDNTAFCDAEVTVHPDYRRRGLGTALLREAEHIGRADGRRSLATGSIGRWEDGPQRSEAGRRFLEAAGYDLVLTEVLRSADIDAVQPAVERELLAQAQAASVDYETIAWTGRTPEEYLAPIAALNSTFLNEAPIGDLDLEPEKIDPDRKRRREELKIERGVFLCGVFARPKGSEEIVATTVIEIHTEPGDVAHQQITLVAPNHRGHRLGMRVKLENHEQLRAARPEVRSIHTGNASVNAAMIAINEQLGFVPVDAWYAYQTDISKTS
ncbi:acetyltransferase (GNAT) family protein [Stackebrandtia endophytica]|uniref:Acetyltransferase (GNAT) family protein n=1 Tax=Stackebrandtia endophytica TaxID=1496996 RepID=A0A543AWL6_9ACTN|nr:GNAT family N-acetyltransferase [Stackebrandtia endophytica]TQL76962.1 acetyltransferase (GNAT) family protein [Stackebrandtia endophytica]